jgi:hypothetical protein
VSSQIYDHLSIEKGCHTNCVTFLAFLTTYFDEHFFLERDISMNNQNQTNTTGAQNLKEFNNTAGCLSVFFVFFCNELIK